VIPCLGGPLQVTRAFRNSPFDPAYPLFLFGKVRRGIRPLFLPRFSPPLAFQIDHRPSLSTLAGASLFPSSVRALSFFSFVAFSGRFFFLREDSPLFVRRPALAPAMVSETVRNPPQNDTYFFFFFVFFFFPLLFPPRVLIACFLPSPTVHTD